MASIWGEMRVRVVGTDLHNSAVLDENGHVREGSAPQFAQVFSDSLHVLEGLSGSEYFSEQ